MTKVGKLFLEEAQEDKEKALADQLFNLFSKNKISIEDVVDESKYENTEDFLKAMKAGGYDMFEKNINYFYNH